MSVAGQRAQTGNGRAPCNCSTWCNTARPHGKGASTARWRQRRHQLVGAAILPWHPLPMLQHPHRQTTFTHHFWAMELLVAGMRSTGSSRALWLEESTGTRPTLRWVIFISYDWVTIISLDPGFAPDLPTNGKRSCLTMTIDAQRNTWTRLENIIALSLILTRTANILITPAPMFLTTILFSAKYPECV